MLDAPSGAPPHALAARDPALSSLPFVPLGRFPTLVHRLDLPLDLADRGRAVELWVKRDDQSGGLYGGNKVRKLEFLLGEARAAGARRLVTLGGFGSHHVLATAIYGGAAGLGLGVDAVVFPQPITPHVLHTLRAAAAAGCTYHPVGGFAGVVPQVVRLRGRRGSFWIAAGGSSPVGTLGYVAAALELAGQIERGECAAPDVIYAALGSCGTVAGLLLGLGMAGLAARVVAVRVVPAIVCNRRATLRLTAQTARLLQRRGVRLPALGELMATASARLTVDGSCYGGAYGRPTDEARGAVERTRGAGLALETTYTGKALAALLADLTAGRLDGQRVLFWNTFSSADLTPLLADAPDLATECARLPPRLADLLSTGAAPRG